MPPSPPAARRAQGRDAPSSPPRFLQTQLTQLQPRPPPPPLTSPARLGFPRPWLPLPPNRLKTRGRGLAPRPPPPPGLGPSHPPPPEVPLTPERAWGRGAARAGRGLRPGRLSAPGGRGRGQRRRSVSPRRRRRRPTPADTHRLHCPPAPPPFRLPSRARPFPPLGPPPAAPRHEARRPPRRGRERSRAPPPGRDVPPAREGAAPPRPSPPQPGRAAGKGPPPSKGMSLVPSPRARWYQPDRSSAPPPPSRRAPAPRPAHHVAPPLLHYFTLGPPTAGTTSCFAWPRPRIPSPVKSTASGDAYSPP